MAHIKIKKGLNIPLSGLPTGEVKDLQSAEAALDFSPFNATIQPRLLVAIGETVQIGQPLIEEKNEPHRIWTSPSSGVVKEIRRGEKRALEAIVIQSDGQFHTLKATPEADPVQFLLKNGLLQYLWKRPFNLPAHPNQKPRSIFVKAIESGPFTPPAELQLKGRESYFQAGLNLLASIAPVHLIYQHDAFRSFQHVTSHTAEGPHPISNPSLHIQLLDPILSSGDVVWTIDTYGVIAIGQTIETGMGHPPKIIALAGGGVIPEQRGYYRVTEGASIQSIITDKLTGSPARLISGDPLCGLETSAEGFLGLGHTVVCSIEETPKRSWLHFFRLKSPAFTSSGAYIQNTKPPISTRLHGEERAFIDPNVYDKVMPLQIPTVPLIKAILAEDFETAETLGILEVVPEDFALPTFICPSKVEMMEIVRKGLQKMAANTQM